MQALNFSMRGVLGTRSKSKTQDCEFYQAKSSSVFKISFCFVVGPFSRLTIGLWALQESQ